MIGLGSTIQTNDYVVNMAKTTIKKGLDAYCSFALVPLSSALPGNCSYEHDARLSSAAKSALATFQSMIESDASAISSLHESLVDADVSAARNLSQV